MRSGGEQTEMLMLLRNDYCLCVSIILILIYWRTRLIITIYVVVIFYLPHFHLQPLWHRQQTRNKIHSNRHSILGPWFLKWSMIINSNCLEVNKICNIEFYSLADMSLVQMAFNCMAMAMAWDLTAQQKWKVNCYPLDVSESLVCAERCVLHFLWRITFACIECRTKPLILNGSWSSLNVNANVNDSCRPWTSCWGWLVLALISVLCYCTNGPHVFGFRF